MLELLEISDTSKSKDRKATSLDWSVERTGDQVNTAPEFERTRENMNEFGACAKAGKSVRTGLSQVMKQMADSQVT